MKQTFKCTAIVYSTGFFSSSCGNTAKYDPDPKGRLTACGIHSKAAVARRKLKSDRRYDEYMRKVNDKQLARDATAEAIRAIREIANGHNDPRTRAAEVVALLDDRK